MDAAYIELVGDGDTIPISGVGFKDSENIKLGEAPEEIFDVPFERSSIPKRMGGRLGRTDIPPRRMTLPLNVSDFGRGRVDKGGVDRALSRLRKLFGSPLKPKRVMWRYTPSDGSSVRWLWLYLDKQIKLTPTTDWARTGYVRAVVSAVALEPRYESKPLELEITTSSDGETVWFPVWNPTDQESWPTWSLIPPVGGSSFTIPDFSFGQEQDVDRSWTAGMHAARTIAIPLISVPWNVMPVRSGMDPYVAADLSNAAGQMGGLFPLYSVPAYTGRKSVPVLLPVKAGRAGSTIRLSLRRFWSAESGLE